MAVASLLMHQETPLRSVDDVLAHQRSWAETNDLLLDAAGKSFVEFSSALSIRELSQLTILDLAQGAGSELERIRSLRSSSCLALNVFEPWRGDPQPLSKIFGGTISSLHFEKKQPTGLKGIAPHLDVFLARPGGPLGIESKFLEMYSPTENHFRDSYFETEQLWSGLRSSQSLALDIATGRQQFRWLHAAQLLKHALGLRRNQPGDFRLALIWYRLDSPVAEEIETEIGRFATQVSDDFDFTAMTYQELTWRMHSIKEPGPGYLDYLDQRYALNGLWHRNLPLLQTAIRPALNHRTSLSSTIDAIDVSEVTRSYFQSVAAAPQRPLREKSFLVGHDGGGDASETHREKVVAKALFNETKPLQIADQTVTLVDYEVPLRAERADWGIGEVDLLGLDNTGRPWIIELKVAPNTETPLKALMQVLRYGAIADANRQAISAEIRDLLGLEARWPAVLAVAADREYWERLLATTAAGAWLEAMAGLRDRLRDALSIDILLLDLGNLEVDLIDSRAKLASPPEVRVL